MNVTCIIPVGPDNHIYLDRAIDSAQKCGVYSEIILCVAAPVEFLPAVQNSLTTGVKLIVSYQPGIGPAKNLAVAQANDGWIATLDSDDFVDCDGQRRLYKDIDTNNYKAGVHYAQVREFDSYHTTPELPKELIWPTKEPNLGWLTTRNQLPVSSWFSRSAWFKVGGFSNVRYEDWHFWKKMMRAGIRMRYAGDYVFYHHRRWEGSIGYKTNWNSDLGHEW